MRGGDGRGRHHTAAANRRWQLVAAQLRKGAGEVGGRGDGGDARQLGRKRRQTPRLDPRLVHQAGIKIAQLAFFRGGGRRGHRFQDGAIARGVEIVQPVEFHPARAVGRDLRVLEPGAADIAVEIVARRDARVHRRQVQPDGADLLGIGNGGASAASGEDAGKRVGGEGASRETHGRPRRNPRASLHRPTRGRKPVQGAARTGRGILQTSIRPAGRMKNGPPRLRRAST